MLEGLLDVKYIEAPSKPCKLVKLQLSTKRF